MTIFGAILLVAITFAFVMYPFFRKKVVSSSKVEGETLGELSSRRDATYSMLKELEFDFQSGLLTDEDYRDLEARYKNRAISILKEMDTPADKAEPEKDSLDEEIEKQVQELRQDTGQFCPQCGQRYQKSDRFCSHCGASLQRRKGRGSD